MCDYSFSITEGIGIAYSPENIIYGYKYEIGPNWKSELLDSTYEHEKPLLLLFVKEREIREKVFSIVAEEESPAAKGLIGGVLEYGHELYICPKCKMLDNRFFFTIKASSNNYIPDYKCSRCTASLKRARLTRIKDREAEVKHEKMLSDLAIINTHKYGAIKNQYFKTPDILDINRKSQRMRCPNDPEIKVIYRNHRNAGWKCPTCSGKRLVFHGSFALWD